MFVIEVVVAVIAVAAAAWVSVWRRRRLAESRESGTPQLATRAQMAQRLVIIFAALVVFFVLITHLQH
jgi:hypothetical protein